VSRNGTDKKLSHPQERAILALLSSRSVPDAAAASGVSLRTLHRWLGENEAFIEGYRAARRQVVEGAVGRLQDAMSEAVDTLRDNRSCGKPAVEVRAALGIIEHSTKAVELWDLEERLSQLEASLEEQDKSGVR
jgi:hypothetical protein